MRTDIILDELGRVTAIHVEWIFDQGYTEAATEGMDADKDGVYTAAELQPVVTENISALKEYRYFVAATANGKDIPYADVTEYGQRINDQGRLSMDICRPVCNAGGFANRTIHLQGLRPGFFHRV